MRPATTAKYWDDQPFLGFGLSAHSYGNGRRFWNLDTYGAYCRAVEERGPAAARAGERLLTRRERAAEALFTGLRRREGVDLAALPLPPWSRSPGGVEGQLRDSFAAGLLAEAGGRVCLTDRGLLVSNEVFSALV